MKIPRCPLCHQPAHGLSPDILALQLKRREAEILAELLRASPRTVPMWRLNQITTTIALRVYISRIRRAIRQTGLNWKLSSSSREGYCLIRGEAEYGKDQIA